MYGWLWRALPGPTPVRLLVAAVLLVVVVAVLFQVVFPALAPLVPVNDGTVDAAGAGPATGLVSGLGTVAVLAAWTP